MRLQFCSLQPSISLEQAKRLPSNFTDVRTFPEKTSSIALGVEGPIDNWETDFIFAYEIFPSYIMRFVSEWQTEKLDMKVGNIIVQRALFPPVGFGICMEFAVRIWTLFNSDKQLGFAYETLSGHVESGVSEFYFEEKEGVLYFTIHTFSKPGHWTTRFAKTLVSLPYQAWCTKRALNYVRRRFYEENALTL